MDGTNEAYEEAFRRRAREKYGISFIVTAQTTPGQLAKAINQHDGFKTVSRTARGVHRIYIPQVGYEGATFKPYYTIFVVFPREPSPARHAPVKDVEETLPFDNPRRLGFGLKLAPRDEPVLTVAEADMERGPLWACVAVGKALALIGIDIAMKPGPVSPIIRNTEHPTMGEYLWQVFGIR